MGAVFAVVEEGALVQAPDGAGAAAGAAAGLVDYRDVGDVVDLEAPANVDWVSGACMILRRRAVEQVGAFDERFFMYFEDADLCRRAREAGWLVFYLPHVEVVHEAGGSSRSRPRAIWLLHKSAFLYHRKHGAHGPLNLFSLLVLLGLSARAVAKLISSLAATLSPGRKAGA